MKEWIVGGYGAEPICASELIPIDSIKSISIHLSCFIQLIIKEKTSVAEINYSFFINSWS